jgi:curved DNA-binding protein CbpA
VSALTHRALVALLDRLSPRLEGMSYFELLDTTPAATARQIQEAFHARAAQLHPDLYRLMEPLTAADRERLQTIYGRMAQAYVTLRDPAEREAYERRIGSVAPAAAPPAAEAAPSTATATTTATAPAPPATGPAPALAGKALTHFRRAQTALRAGDIPAAVLNLKLALASQPDSAFLRDALREAQAVLKRP